MFIEVYDFSSRKYCSGERSSCFQNLPTITGITKHLNPKTFSIENSAKTFSPENWNPKSSNNPQHKLGIMKS
jgi:hypothetical protein